MSTTSAVRSTTRPLDLTGRGRGAAVDRGFRLLALGAGLTVLVVLAGIVLSTTLKAWPAFSWDYFTGTKLVKNDSNELVESGILAYVYGTVVVSLIAVLFAVPVSVGIALFVTEVAPRRIRAAIVTVLDLLASVPSVVFGLWGFLTIRPTLNDLYNRVADAVSGIPVVSNILGRSSSGNSFMTAGLIVGLMIVPIVTSLAREVFNTVPRNDKDGALALGATRWEMIKGVVLPHSSGGLVGAVMLGLGRAMGETIAIALVVGANPQIVADLFAPGEAMPAAIVRNLPEAAGDYQAALIGLGVVLFAVTVLVNISARTFVVRVDRRLKGSA